MWSGVCSVQENVFLRLYIVWNSLGQYFLKMCCLAVRNEKSYSLSNNSVTSFQNPVQQSPLYSQHQGDYNIYLKSWHHWKQWNWTGVLSYECWGVLSSNTFQMEQPCYLKNSLSQRTQVMKPDPNCSEYEKDKFPYPLVLLEFSCGRPPEVPPVFSSGHHQPPWWC